MKNFENGPAGSRRVRGRRAAGFTLLELLIVLFLISIVIVIASVSLVSTARSSGLQAAAASISAAFMRARALAVLEGRREDVLVDLDQKEFGIKNGKRGMKHLGRGIYMKVINPDGATVRSGTCRIAFFPSGSASDKTVVVWNEKDQYSIEPDPVTGAAEIKKFR